jgi:hypothetical protein
MRPASRSASAQGTKHRTTFRRLLRRALIVPATAGLVLGVAGTAVAATASAPTPSATPQAALGPGLRAAPSTIPAFSVHNCASAAAKAGFSYTKKVDGYPEMVVAVAIALAESSCNPSASLVNSNGCVDRGLWQIDNCAWPNVSNACAYQYQCNAAAAWNISDHGTDWNPWSTFGSGAWRNYVSLARSDISGFAVELKNKADGTCLDADSGSVHNGGTIFQYSCNSSDRYQLWEVVDAYGSNPVLRNEGAGTCLDADASDVRNAGKIFQWACSNSAHFEQWSFGGSGELNGNALATVHSVGAGTCLDADGGAAGKGDPIYQWKCSNSDGAQRWS